TTSSLPGGIKDAVYAPQVLTATGGTTPYVWSINSGSLPPGLTLTPDGLISGTPTATGTFNFVVKVTGANALTDTKSLFIIINTTSQPQPQITTSSLPSGVINVAYPPQALGVAGGTSPYIWSLPSGTLPPGLTLSPDGIISGTPTALGTFNIVIKVTDNNGAGQSASKSFAIVIATPLLLTTASLPDATAGSPYSQALTATGGTPPYLWSALSGLPPGLTLAASGIISGTPTASGPFSITLRVTDSGNPAQISDKALPITIKSQPTLVITPATLPVGIVGVFYAQALTAVGPSPVTWSVISGVLPPGITLATNGSLTGSPTVVGTFGFQAQATAGTPVQTATESFVITIKAAL